MRSTHQLSEKVLVEYTRINNILFTLFICCFLTHPVLAGRADKAGSTAAPQLLIPVGAASLATGGSNLAFVSGTEAIYWNPAGLARMPYKFGAIFSHMNYFADIGVEYFGIATNVEDLASLGLSVKMLSVGDIAITTEDYPDGTGSVVSPTFVTISAIASRMITDKISFGVAGHYIIEEMENVSANGIAFTAGLQYTGLGGIDALSLGVVLRNLGPPLKYEGEGLTYLGSLDDVLSPSSKYKVEASSDPLPSTIEIGIGYKFDIMNEAASALSVTFQNNNYSADEYKTGLEIIYLNQFAIRGGYSISSEESDNYLFGSTFGLGMQTKIEGININFDYCYRSLRYLSNNHNISVQIGID